MPVADVTDRPIEVAPSRTGRAVATGAILAAAAALAVAGVPGAVVPAVLAVAAVIGGLRRSHRRAITVGGFLAAVATIVAGALGGETGPVLVATGCVVLAWDAAETAVTNGQQLGTAATPGSTERIHLAATAGILVVATSAVYGVYRLSRGGLSTAAVLALLAGGVLLLLALRG